MVETARRLMAERGIGATTARAIQHGTAGRRASLAPGSLFYYFGSKERVLIEVLRAEVAGRLEVLAHELAAVTTFDQFVDALERALARFLDTESGSDIVLLELVGEARRQPELAAAQAELYKHWRVEFAAMLDDLERRGAIVLRGPSRPLAELITAVGQGLGVQQYTTPGWDRGEALTLLRELLRATVAPPDNR
jgi:AcrR family transcriptional regulator